MAIIFSFQGKPDITASSFNIIVDRDSQLCIIEYKDNVGGVLVRQSMRLIDANMLGRRIIDNQQRKDSSVHSCKIKFELLQLQNEIVTSDYYKFDAGIQGFFINYFDKSSHAEEIIKMLQIFGRGEEIQFGTDLREKTSP